MFELNWYSLESVSCYNFGLEIFFNTGACVYNAMNKNNVWHSNYYGTRIFNLELGLNVYMFNENESIYCWQKVRDLIWQS